MIVPASGFATDLAISTPPNITYRVPAIAVTGSGAVLVAYDRRHARPADLPGSIDILFRRSIDNGRTWSRPRTLIAYPKPEGCGDASLLVDRDTGRILLFFISLELTDLTSR